MVEMCKGGIMYSLSLILRKVFISLILIFSVYVQIAFSEVMISPEEDVYIVTYGGGEGCNPFLKYDITSVPQGVIVDSVFLRVYAWNVDSIWDGDVNYWNVNNQTWTEVDSSGLIWNSPTSDSVHQSGDFGVEIGWTKSIDIKNIFLTDYNVANTYCSIKMKDPDDPTINPMPGSYPVDSDDSLQIGNRLFEEDIIFYPHEYPNSPPWLIVYYHETGIHDVKKYGTVTEQLLKVSPNPFTEKVTLSIQKKEKMRNSLPDRIQIFDLCGRLVNSYPILSYRLSLGANLEPGVYFIKASGFETVTIIKLR